MMNRRLIITFVFASVLACLCGCATRQGPPSTDTTEQVDIRMETPAPIEEVPDVVTEREIAPATSDSVQPNLDNEKQITQEPTQLVDNQSTSEPETETKKESVTDDDQDTKQEPQPEPQAEPEKKTEQEPVQEPEPEIEVEQKQPADAAENQPQTVKSETSDEPIEEESDDINEELLKAETEIKEPAYYDKCDHIFKTYIDENGLVDYDTLRRKRVELIAAAKEFDAVSPLDMFSWSKEEKIALWINAYNIFTLKLIVDNYPIQPHWIFRLRYPESSIMQIPGAWTKNYFKVMGIEYTLREIEREMLLARFEDPRICFALSNATKGGAFLRNECYRPEILDKQLEEQVLKYMLNPKGFKIDTANNFIYISNIFNTQKDTFIKKFGAVKRFRTRKNDIRSFLNFITGYVPEENTKYFESDNYSVKFIEFDWHLNEQPRK